MEMEESGLDFQDIIRIIRKRLGLILSLALLAGVISGVISWLILPEIYQANTTIIVSSQKSKLDNSAITYNDYTLNLQLVNSYQVLCKTERVLEQVIKETGVSLTADQLAEKITVAAAKNTEIINISVKDEDPLICQQIANNLADVFQREVVTIMKMDNVQIIDYAKLPTTPIAPAKTRNLALGIILGFALGIGLAFSIEFLDMSVKSIEQVEKILGVPVLGTVPQIGHSRKRKVRK